MTDASGQVDDATARRSRLVGLKLRALVRDHLADDSVGQAAIFPPGAALIHQGDAWVFLDDRPGTRLGASLAWALRSGAETLHVVSEADTGVLARRSGQFSIPISVWRGHGRDLVPAVPAPPQPHLPASSAHEVFRGRIEEGGADVVVEHGVLFGEVRGLEVCRVVDDPDAVDAAFLEVGVGAHDREAYRMVHGDLPDAESLARVVRAVSRYRVPGGSPHPLNRLAAERLIRWRLEQQPQLVGATALVSAPPPVPRANLKDPVPCVAAGPGRASETVVVVCSSGVDLDVVPYAADARLAARAAAVPGAGGDIRLVVAMPTRDRLPVTAELAGLLAQAVEFVSVD